MHVINKSIYSSLRISVAKLGVITGQNKKLDSSMFKNIKFHNNLYDFSSWYIQSLLTSCTQEAPVLKHQINIDKNLVIFQRLLNLLPSNMMQEFAMILDTKIKKQ